MRPVVTAEEMRALDRSTIEDLGLPAVTLMETAGRAVAAAALAMLGAPRGHVAVVCGPGNNGGDGFVVARVLRARGVDAIAYLAIGREAVRGDARLHLDILERAGGVVRSIATPQALDEVQAELSGAALVVDALFGIGKLRPLEGHLASVVAAINAAARTLAVDIPSGLDADTGAVAGCAVAAERTVTMGALKIALVSAPGFAHCGEVEVADIGIPPGFVTLTGAGLVEEADVRGWLPAAGALDHKGTRGHLLVVGGTRGMEGAGRLASLAGLRAGAGLVTLATDAAPAGDPAFDAVMVRPLAGPLAPLAPLFSGKRAITIGCGLGKAPAAAGWVREVLAAGIPAVLDADALNLLAADPRELAGAAGPLVLTPHPAEAARLLGSTTAEVEADRLSAARALAGLTDAVVVLKGARTVICDGTIDDEFCAINPTGSPALATGGTGDVLAGVIGALLAQGLAAGDAARAGAYVHGLAGEQLARVHGPRGVVSSDLPAAIAFVLRSLV